jgi:hypothetical protein
VDATSADHVPIDVTLLLTDHSYSIGAHGRGLVSAEATRAFCPGIVCASSGPAMRLRTVGRRRLQRAVGPGAPGKILEPSKATASGNGTGRSRGIRLRCRARGRAFYALPGLCLLTAVISSWLSRMALIR